MENDKNLPAAAPAAAPLVSQPSPAEAMFAGLMDLMKNPDVNPANMAQILDVQERLLDRQARSEFNAAKAAAMSEMPRIAKDGSIKNKNGQVQSKFARFESIDKIVRPICSKHGLSYSFTLGEGERGAVRVTCILAHVGGHSEEHGPLSVPVDTSGAKNPTQGVGSSASYGKRYTLCAALNIITDNEDDDGASAGRQRGAAQDPEWAEAVLQAGQIAATGGPAAYAEYFTSLSPMRKGWLVESGHHGALKDGAEEHRNA